MKKEMWVISIILCLLPFLSYPPPTNKNTLRMESYISYVEILSLVCNTRFWEKVHLPPKIVSNPRYAWIKEMKVLTVAPATITDLVEDANWWMQNYGNPKKSLKRNLERWSRDYVRQKHWDELEKWDVEKDLWRGCFWMNSKNVWRLRGKENKKGK